MFANFTLFNSNSEGACFAILFISTYIPLLLVSFYVSFLLAFTFFVVIICLCVFFFLLQLNNLTLLFVDSRFRSGSVINQNPFL